MNRIEKVKSDGSKVRIEYSVKRTDGRYDEQALSSFDVPLPSFTQALRALAEDVCMICELPADYAERMRISGVSISWTNDIMGAVITGQRKVKGANSPVILNTPHLPSSDYGEGDGPTLSLDTIERVQTLIEECNRYIAGERAQQELPLAPASELLAPATA